MNLLPVGFPTKSRRFFSSRRSSSSSATGGAGNGTNADLGADLVSSLERLVIIDAADGEDNFSQQLFRKQLVEKLSRWQDDFCAVVGADIADSSAEASTVVEASLEDAPTTVDASAASADALRGHAEDKTRGAFTLAQLLRVQHLLFEEIFHHDTGIYVVSS